MEGHKTLASISARECVTKYPFGIESTGSDLGWAKVLVVIRMYEIKTIFFSYDFYIKVSNYIFETNQINDLRQSWLLSK